MAYKLLIKELQFSFSKSSGSGGQNVNKVNTRVTLRWNVLKTQSLSQSMKERFLKNFSNRILDDGTLVINSQRFRLQARNIADCIAKLNVMIQKVEIAPKKRRATKPKKSAIESRLKNKKKLSEKKRLRKIIE